MSLAISAVGLICALSQTVTARPSQALFTLGVLLFIFGVLAHIEQGER